MPCPRRMCPNPVTAPAGVGEEHLFMKGSTCHEAQGPVVPNSQAINISKDAYPTIKALLDNSQLWQLGIGNKNHFEAKTDFEYYSIATSSNSYGGTITSSNVSSFHATICGDNASQNALIILDASGGITKNRS